MFTKLKKITLILLLSIVPVFTLPAQAHAACSPDTSSKGQIQTGLGESGSDCSDDQISEIVKKVVRLLSIIAGMSAVIMIIIAGIKYTTSGGDSSSVSSAKNTLIYALIGLAIAVLAQVLVQFALDVGSNAEQACSVPGKEKIAASSSSCKP